MKTTSRRVNKRMHQLRNITDAYQCFFFSRSIGYVTPKIIHFHYLKKYFLDQSIQYIFLFIFENRSTDAYVQVRYMQQSYLLKRGQRMKHLVRRWYLLISDMLCTATHPFAQVCKRIGRVVHAAIERSSKNGAMNGVTGVLFTFEDGSQKMLFGNRSECHSWVMAVHVNSKAEATQLNKLFEVRAENVR